MITINSQNKNILQSIPSTFLNSNNTALCLGSPIKIEELIGKHSSNKISEENFASLEIPINCSLENLTIGDSIVSLKNSSEFQKNNGILSLENIPEELSLSKLTIGMEHPSITTTSANKLTCQINLTASSQTKFIDPIANPKKLSSQDYPPLDLTSNYLGNNFPSLKQQGFNIPISAQTAELKNEIQKLYQETKKNNELGKETLAILSEINSSIKNLTKVVIENKSSRTILSKPQKDLSYNSDKNNTKTSFTALPDYFHSIEFYYNYMEGSLWFILHLSQRKIYPIFIKPLKCNYQPDFLAKFFMDNPSGANIDCKKFARISHTLGGLRITKYLRKAFLKYCKKSEAYTCWKGTIINMTDLPTETSMSKILKELPRFIQEKHNQAPSFCFDTYKANSSHSDSVTSLDL
ncbi:MAG: hypothetical protein P9M03_05010 [Candidatus Theseobacter exili]|nr:hypothetical protein [Candidatus Theseobacter exili]